MIPVIKIIYTTYMNPICHEGTQTWYVLFHLDMESSLGTKIVSECEQVNGYIVTDDPQNDHYRCQYSRDCYTTCKVFERWRKRTCKTHEVTMGPEYFEIGSITLYESIY